MSTFDGVVKEYPLISIDNFLEESKNFQSTVFFLSHCHADHMKGLRDRKFFQLLESRGFSQIYMSDVSEHLLKNDEVYTHLSKYLISLPLEQPTLVNIFDESGDICSRVVVTLLTAGHCPGSVMFLIEGDCGRVLYTGDFRLPVGGSARLPPLHDENGRLKPMDSLYIDTTFCSEKCLYIPTREQCLVEILRLVEEWLCKGPNHIVNFICPAQYNYEFVFVEIFKKLGEKTHVFEQKLKKYKGIKIIEDAVTSVPNEARVHACVSGFSNDFKEILYLCETPCGYKTEDLRPIKVRQIKPSAMFFQRKEFSELSTIDKGSQVHRVCFATHSSLDEIRDMVKYLNPKQVFPNVVHQTTVEQILYLIGAPYRNFQSDSLSPLGYLRNELNQDESMLSTNSLPFYDDCYKIPHQPKFLDDSTNAKTVKTASKETNIPQLSQYKSVPKDIETLIPLKDTVEPSKNNATTFEKPSNSSSPVKWVCPIFSSDDENFDPNSSFSSSRDKSDSEAFATSEEQNVTELSEICFTQVNSKVAHSELPVKANSVHEQQSNIGTSVSISNIPVEEQKVCSGIKFELTKLLASQEANDVSVVNSECKTQERLDSSTNRETIKNCSLNTKPLYSKVVFDSKVHGNESDISNTIVNLVKSGIIPKTSYHIKSNINQSDTGSQGFHSHNIPIVDKDVSFVSPKSTATQDYSYSKFSYTKQSNMRESNKRSFVVEAYNKGQIIEKPSPWRSYKLILNEETSASISDTKSVDSQLNLCQGQDICNDNVGVLIKKDFSIETKISKVESCLNSSNEQNKSYVDKVISKACSNKSSVHLDLHTFKTKTIHEVNDRVKKSNLQVTTYSMKTAAKTEVCPNKPSTILDHQLLNTKSLNKCKAIKSSNSQVCNSQTVAKKRKTKSASRRNSSAFKRELPELSQPMKVIGGPNHNNTLANFSKKLRDPSVSKYEKIRAKPQRKESVVGHSQSLLDNDVAILSYRNKCDEMIQVVDLSSDEYDSAVELFDDADCDQTLASKSSKDNQISDADFNQTLATKSSKLIKDNQTSDEEDSPSLLVPKKNRQNVIGVSSHEHSDSGRKRKSTDMNDFNAKRSPILKVVDDCDADVDSTPEDLLPFTHSQVSSYLVNLL